MFQFMATGMLLQYVICANLPDTLRKCKIFYGQNPPPHKGESTTTVCGINYQLLAVICCIFYILFIFSIFFMLYTLCCLKIAVTQLVTRFRGIFSNVLPECRA